jgi:hypothetical protein
VTHPSFARAAHPNAIRLEAFACGEGAPGVAAHVDECEACRAYVDRARRAAHGPEDAALDVARLIRTARARERSRRMGRVVALGVPLATAAAVGLWVHHARVAPPAPVLEAPVHESVTAPIVSAPPVPEPDTTFKGGLQLAVIRERGGAQARFTETVRVRPGDRLRIEVAVDRPQSILGAVVGDDGTYVEVMADAVRPAGTHFSERSARVDASPLHGTILAGAPEAVRRARATGAYAGVASIRVEWEASP